MAIKFIQLPTCRLAEFVASATTSFDVSGFLYNDGITAVDPADIGDVCFATLEPRTPREELISFTIDSVTAAGVATITAVRGLSQKSPYGTGGAAFDHQNGSDFVISNNPGLFNQLAAKDNEETITEQWIFPTPTAAGAPVTKSYAEAQFVYKTGDQSIDGIKTFIEPVVVPDAVAMDEAVNLGQVEDLDDANVKLTGDQTIAGVKAFSSSPTVPTATTATQAMNKSQVESYIAANSGDEKATDAIFGQVKLDVAADDIAEPVAYSATADRVAALAGGGDFDTPSAINKFLTEGFVCAGDGSDGDVVISTDTTLTEDKFYNNLTINSGIKLFPDGYRIFVKGILTGPGTISFNGNDGANATDATASAAGVGGAAGAASGVGPLKSVAGTNGETGANQTIEQSGAGTAVNNTTPGVSGSRGGAGGSTSGASNHISLAPASSAGTSSISENWKMLRTSVINLMNLPTSVDFITQAASTSTGGGGGVGNNSTNTLRGRGGGGGGAGASGGFIFVVANNVVGPITFEAIGGDGGNGSNGNTDPDNFYGGGGGGAGGAGGTVVLVYGNKTDTITYTLTGGTGGAGGAGTTPGNGASGENGLTGAYYELRYSSLL